MPAEPVGNGCAKLAEEARLYRALTCFDVNKDILVSGLENIGHWGDSIHCILDRAQCEGKLPYEEPTAGSSTAGMTRGRAESPLTDET